MATRIYRGPFAAVELIYQGQAWTVDRDSELEVSDELAALLDEGQGGQWEQPAAAGRTQTTTGVKTAGEEN